MLNSDRGRKALTARVLPGSAARETGTAESRESDHRVAGNGTGAGTVERAVDRPRSSADDDGLCDVLSERSFLTETSEILLTSVPDLTAAQIVEIRRQMVVLARRHGWLDD
jgi:hypothetical protein